MHTDESEAHAEPPPDGGAKQRRDLELARGCTVEAFYARRLQDKAIRETAVGTPPPPLDLGHYARLSDTQKLRVYTAYVAHGGASPPGYVVERRSDGARGSARPAAAAAAAAGAEPAPVVEVAEGLRLHVSSSNATGYVAVAKKHSRFQVQHRVAERRVFLGCFDTAMAVAYARVVG